MPQGPELIPSLEAGLRGVGLRGKAIANNIANIETPGYRRRDVLFEAVLADAIEDGNLADLHENEAWVFAPGTAPVGPNGNDVSLDMEIGELVKNGALYKTYVRLLARMYRQMDLAMRDELR